MTNARIFLFFLLLNSALTACSFGDEKPVDDRPNIVLIMVDDLGYADLGCYGGKAIPTPNLDRLAKEGIRFTNAYSGCTVCGPARSSLMDGKHLGHTSVRLNTGGVPLLKEDFTIAEMLKKSGYRTGGFGKWGLGELGTDGQAHLQGFDEFYGYYHQIHAHYYLPDYLIRNGKKEPLPGNKGFYRQMGHYKDGPFPRKTESGVKREFASDLIFDETLSFIKKNAKSDQPFFCYAAWTPPHGEFKIPADDPAWTLFEKKPWPMKAKVVAAYDAMIDRQVGQLMKELKNQGIDNNTIVFFLSDHGADQRYDGHLNSSGKLKGSKRSMYEGGLRVPLLARYPNRIKPGSVSDLPCYFPDFMPTLADLAKTQTPKNIDGLSFLPTLTGKGNQQRHPYLYWEWHPYDWKNKRLAKGGLWQAARIDHWKAVKMGAEKPIEVYDLREDIGEKENLANNHPELVAKFEKILTEAHTPMRPQAEPPKVNGKSYR